MSDSDERLDESRLAWTVRLEPVDGGVTMWWENPGLEDGLPFALSTEQAIALGERLKSVATRYAAGAS